MRNPWFAFIPALVCMLLLSACSNSRKEEARELPDPAGLIAEHRMKEIRRHQRLVVGIAPSPLADAERHLVSALLKDTGYRFRIITAEKETLFAFLRGARADIVCGLFTGQELKDAYLVPRRRAALPRHRAGAPLCDNRSDEAQEASPHPGSPFPRDGKDAGKACGFSL